MASSYTPLGIELQATGENAGTWGTKTNTNLELIGEALGFGTEAITTNADTHTSTVADASADEARALYLKPKFIILDESTNSLDKKTENEILNQFFSLKGNKTLIMISHSPLHLIR